jgi:predicted amidohydrolase YtcJ
MLKQFLAYFFVILMFSACQNKSVDLLVHGGKIYTVDEGFEVHDVMLIRNGKIIATGGNSLMQHVQAKETLDLKGASVYPGFIDAHCHFTGYAMDFFKLDLHESRSFLEAIDLMKKFAADNPRQWIEARNWDEHLWTPQSLPDKKSLDLHFPDRPVIMLRVDGHVALCNQKALDLAGIQKQTKVPGGQFEIKNEQLTGFVFDAAIAEIQKKIPPLNHTEALKGMQDLEKKCFAFGLTSLTDCWVKSTDLSHLQKAFQSKQLRIPVTCMLEMSKENIQNWMHQKPYQDDHLHIAGFKIFSDGALGSRGACLHEPYLDQANHYGQLSYPQDSLEQMIAQIAKSSYQCCVHAIGDSAVSSILKMYQKYLPSSNQRRWRIEHAQVILLSDTAFFRQWNIIPSVQPTHAMSDMAWAEKRLGAMRLQNAYLLNTLKNQLGWMPLGTDFPVESPDPLKTFIAAVFRKNISGIPQGGFQIKEALSREDALRGMTIWAAKASFDEKYRGSLEKGKWADFVILDTDLMEAPERNVVQSKVLATYSKGQVVFRK